MTALLWLVPAALLLGLMGLTAFFWSIKSGQFEDTKGDSERILLSDDHPIISDDES